MTGAQYETALKLACKQRNELREQRRVLQEACFQYQCERDEARKAARFFRDLYVSCVGRTYPEEYSLPWEVMPDETH